MNDISLTDFTDLRFQKAFQTHSQELGIQVRDWEGLFTEMNGDSHGNAAYVRLDGERAAGFIQFCPMELSGWFFSQKLGFIREFWIAPEYRGQGVAQALMAPLLSFAQSQGCSRLYLDTRISLEPAVALYLRFGFQITYQEGLYIQMEWNAFNAGPV